MANSNLSIIPNDRYASLIASERDAQLLKKILKQKADANEGIYASEVIALAAIFCCDAPKDGDTE